MSVLTSYGFGSELTAPSVEVDGAGTGATMLGAGDVAGYGFGPLTLAGGYAPGDAQAASGQAWGDALQGALLYGFGRWIDNRLPPVGYGSTPITQDPRQGQTPRPPAGSGQAGAGNGLVIVGVLLLVALAVAG